MSDRYDGYGVELHEESGRWVAHLLELPEVSAHGDTPEDALTELADAWALVKACYKQDGQPVPVAPARRNYSGQFQVRIDKRLHRELAVEAARAGVSLNALVAAKLSGAATAPRQGR